MRGVSCFLIVLFLVMTTSIALAEETEIECNHTITLDEAMELALEHNKTVRRARLQTHIARLSYYLIHEGSALPGLDIPDLDLPEDWLSSESRMAMVKQAQAGHSSYTESMVAVQIERMYIDLLRIEQMIELAHEGLEIAERHLHLAQTLHEIDMAIELDIMQARSAVADAKAHYESMQATRALAVAGFNIQIGRDIDAELNVVDMLDDVTVVAEIPDLERLEQTSLRHRFEVRQALEMVAVSEYEMDIMKGAGGSSLSYELAKLEHEEAELELDMARDEVIMDVRARWTELTDAVRRLSVSTVAADVATEQLRLAEIRYENGLMTVFELSAARLQYMQETTALINAYYDYHVAYVELAAATGR